MFLITPEDLKTHMYEEIVQEITREDEEVITEAIMTAIDEAKGYLGRYDLDKLFGTESTDPVINDRNLKSKVKDLVKWYLVRLGNPHIDYAIAEAQYKTALEFYFERVQSGKIKPDGWPYKDTAAIPQPPQGLAVNGSSNRKRSNHW